MNPSLAQHYQVSADGAFDRLLEQAVYDTDFNCACNRVGNTSLTLKCKCTRLLNVSDKVPLLDTNIYVTSMVLILKYNT